MYFVALFLVYLEGGARSPDVALIVLDGLGCQCSLNAVSLYSWRDVRKPFRIATRFDVTIAFVLVHFSLSLSL